MVAPTNLQQDTKSRISSVSFNGLWILQMSASVTMRGNHGAIVGGSSFTSLGDNLFAVAAGVGSASGPSAGKTVQVSSDDFDISTLFSLKDLQKGPITVLSVHSSNDPKTSTLLKIATAVTMILPSKDNGLLSKNLEVNARNMAQAIGTFTTTGSNSAGSSASSEVDNFTIKKTLLAVTPPNSKAFTVAGGSDIGFDSTKPDTLRTRVTTDIYIIDTINHKMIDHTGTDSGG